MTDKILVSRKEIEDWINRNQRWAQHSACDGDLVVVAQDLRALLDKAEVSEPVGWGKIDDTGYIYKPFKNRDHAVIYYGEASVIPIYISPPDQSAKISELEAEIARLKAIT